MRLFAALFVVFLAWFVAPPSAAARVCPGKLSAHLYELHETLSFGAELRAFYFGIAAGEDFPSSPSGNARDFQNNVLLGLRPLLVWYPHDDVTIWVENELRYRWPGWNERTPPGLDHRPVHIFLEWDDGSFRLAGGLQSLTFGTAALLDQRFVAVSAGYRQREFALEVFGGATERRIMRNAANSMWMRYISSSTGYKFLSEDVLENWVAGLTFHLKVFKPYKLKLLYLFAYPGIPNLRSHAVSLAAEGPIVEGRLSFTLEPLVLIDDEGQALPGLVGELRAHFAKGRHAPRMQFVFVAALRGLGRHQPRPVYENLSHGLVRRYSIYHGYVAGLRASWPVTDWVKPFAHYHAQTSDFSSDFSDELDLGADFQVNDLYRLRIAYVGLNLGDDQLSSHAFYAEARIIFGEP